MRLIKTILLAVILIGLVLMAVANRDMISIQLLPANIAEMAQFNAEITLPKFAVILAAVAVGLLLGYIIEYLRETKHRKEVRRKERDLKRVAAELDEVRRKTGEGEDEVLKILKQAS